MRCLDDHKLVPLIRVKLLSIGGGGTFLELCLLKHNGMGAVSNPASRRLQKMRISGKTAQGMQIGAINS